MTFLSPDTKGHGKRGQLRIEAATARQNAMALVPELGQLPGGRSYHLPMRALSTFLAALLVVGLFFAGWAYHSWVEEVGSQVEPQASDVLPSAEVATYRQAAVAARSLPAGVGVDPIVIAYHDISEEQRSSEYVVSQHDFALQMQMLHEAGYHTMTADEFTGFVRGTHTPRPRSVLLTFDDGTAGLYRIADPILARYGFTAVSFLISGRVGTHRPYYLSWRQVARMHESGRWDFESHTHDLHTQGEIANGGTGSLLSNRLNRDGLEETQKAFQVRVSADLTRSIQDIADHGLPRPTLFAYPFSDVGRENPNDPIAQAFVESEVDRLFAASFIDAVTDHALPATPDVAASGVVQRMEILRQTTAATMFAEMQRMETLPVGDFDPTTVDSTWLEPSGHVAPLELQDGAVQADALSLSSVTADWAIQRTSMWDRYSVQARITTDTGGVTSAGLRARVEHAGELVAVVRHKHATLSQGGHELARMAVVSGDHLLRIEVTPTETTVMVDGQVLGTVAAPVDPADARGGFGITAARSSLTVPFPKFTELRVAPL